MTDVWTVRCLNPGCGTISTIPVHQRRCPGCDGTDLEEVEGK